MLNSLKVNRYSLFSFSIISTMQLERAWNSLTWTEKLSLVTSVVRGITSPYDPSQKEMKVSLLPLIWSSGLIEAFT